ncbi:unnamed protein product [Euphydryas editha]|uniref:Secreted protein n=1 Tax=Euphydryas editha TaxID=104508 RepID=A0AAU9TNP1_EUPED|nr:unnamed protein product [Euphydryas editha]
MRRGNKNLGLVRCVCRSLQLALSHAAAETRPRYMEFLIRETHNWFLNYQRRNSSINDSRWISIEPAVCRILEQWMELKTLFVLRCI